LNFEALHRAALDPEQYGRLLSDAIFYDDPTNQIKLLAYLNNALAIVQDGALDLHVSLFVDPRAAELHHLHWETLLNPQDGSFLAWDQNILFSRHLYALELGQMELRSKGDLRALVFVANPADLSRPQGFSLRTGAESERRLAPVNVAGEVERAKNDLKGIQKVDVIASDPQQPGQATLENLFASLNAGYDIIYLVCHGALLPDDPDQPGSLYRSYLLLEKSDGSYEVANGERLVNFIRDLHLSLRPRLVALASCQSAGQGLAVDPAEISSADQGELAALGPLLAESGIPAVLAMLDNVKMDTVAKFMPVFFKQLLTHGLVDRAMAAARSALQGSSDWWAPVLFMRLTGGELWFDAGFSTRDNEFDTWRGIIDSIQPELVPNRKSK
jgi:CHAT domain-containing protein